MAACAALATFALVFAAFPTPIQAHPAMAPYPWQESRFTLDGSAESFRYDGHGAMSAGATSRLLYDYPEPQRGEILDYLFKPRFGASLHMLKVEIGGDTQSAHGTEPSHMHLRGERSCKRGYELWLLAEARRRNPSIVTYALTWGVPGWLGERAWEDGFYSKDGIDYLLSWLACCKELGIGTINFLGQRSKRPWAPSNWTVILRNALDVAGFSKTRLVLPDGPYDPSVLDMVAADTSFANAMSGGVVGLHYPCFQPRPEVRLAGFDYWSTEDAAVEGDWNGAGCLGRLLNHNFVLQNMTSTVARSLVWSLYPGLASNSTGLIDASEPWSARYGVRETAWAMAHTTQFTQVGWRLLGTYEGPSGLMGSSGKLYKGGTYVTYMSSGRRRTRDFTLVVEKLHGVCPRCSMSDVCPRCSKQEASAEPLTFYLQGLLEASAPTGQLGFWKSNATHKFVQLPDIQVVDSPRRFTFTALPDSMYTVSTTRGQSRGTDTLTLASTPETEVTTTTTTTTALLTTSTTTTTTTTWTTTSTTTMIVEAELFAPGVVYRSGLNTFWPSNIGDTKKSPEFLFVTAGVLYPGVNVYARAGLGSDSQVIRVKLMPEDPSATLMRCVIGDSYMTAPWDGSQYRAVHDVNEYQDINLFTNLRFPRGGYWKLCYSADSIRWEELKPVVHVSGATYSDNKIWCALSLISRTVCQTDPSTVGCQCQGKLEGFQRIGVEERIEPLGLAYPANPAWKLALSSEEDCGNSIADPFVNTASSVVNRDGYEVHNFGTVKTAALGTWRLCYCPGFDYDNGRSTFGILRICNPDDARDFQQFVGRLVIVDVATLHETVDTTITVYPLLKFRLRIFCGNQARRTLLRATAYAGSMQLELENAFGFQAGDIVSVGVEQHAVAEIASDNTIMLRTHLLNRWDQGEPVAQQEVGGSCSESTDIRYKILLQVDSADLPYFEEESACHFSEQAATTVSGGKVFGGQIGPQNCNATDICADEPELVGPVMPTWDDVQLAASYENGVMVAASYDVCYCDRECEDGRNWFKAGSVTVLPTRVFFSSDGSTAVRYPVVNTGYYITVEGTGGSGGWSMAGSNANVREMKILRNIHGVSSLDCFFQEQPSVVSGHDHQGSNTDLASPTATFTGSEGMPLGHRYGGAAGIAISRPGPYAVCYCDENCTVAESWGIFGRVLIAGPTPSQSWTHYVGMTFDLNVKGWGLTSSNRIKLLGSDVWGPDAPAEVLDQSRVNSHVVDIAWHAEGTQVTLDRAVNLKDSDVIIFDHVDVVGSVSRSDMFNTFHKITASCDEPGICYQMILPITFPADEFPTFNGFNQILWRRSSEEDFRRMKITTAGEYPVVWSNAGSADVYFVGSAGVVTVEDPREMHETFLGLTTVKPNADGAPVIIAFKTSDVADYSQITGQMSLRIQIMPGKLNPADPNAAWEDAVEFRDVWKYPLDTSIRRRSIQTRESATQFYCGLFFAELWSEDSDGFPMPESCYYDEDDTDASMRLEQLHIVFTPRNHLKRNTQYMIVMNMNVLPELQSDFPPSGAIHVWSMGDYLLDPFRVVERGRAFASPVDRVPAPAGTVTYDSTKPMFDPVEGFTVLAADGSPATMVELKMYCKAHDASSPADSPPRHRECKECVTERDCGNTDPSRVWCVSPTDAACPETHGDRLQQPAFTIELRARSGHPIRKNQHLRLFLHPLTQWNIGQSCQEMVGWHACTPQAGMAACDLQCITESIVDGAAGNGSVYPASVMKITFASMSDITDSHSHILAVGALPLPVGGFCPQYLTAELMDENEVAPDYWDLQPGLSPRGGAQLYMQPRVLSASIVSYPGDGNPRPFHGDLDNRLYIRFVMGTTLNPRSMDTIEITLTLPEYRLDPSMGYRCLDVEGMRHRSLPEFGHLRGRIPSSAGKFDGAWSGAAERYCSMPLTGTQALFAGSVVYFEIAVNNPAHYLGRDDPTNKYELTVTQGAMSAVPFTLTGSGPGYSGSVTVRGKLTETLVIAPINFLPSPRFATTVGPETNWILVFFKTEIGVGSEAVDESEIWVDAPAGLGFDFGEHCMASGLPPNYHMPEVVPQPLRIPPGSSSRDDPFVCRGGLPSVAGDQTKYRRAMTRTVGRLFEETFYGFRLAVSNANAYAPAWSHGWRIHTYTVTGAIVDGSPEEVHYEQQLSCLTYGTAGVGAGYQCRFPFTHNGVTYDGCTRAGYGRLWCSTQLDARGRHMLGFWGECAELCKESPGTATTAYFPLPLIDDFERYGVDDMAKYFADYAGSWQVAEDPTRPDNLVLKQWVQRRPGSNQWTLDVEPMSLVGYGMVDVAVSTVLYIPHDSAKFPPPSGAGPDWSTIQSAFSGRCIATSTSSAWNGAVVAQHTCEPHGSPGFNGRFKYDQNSGYLSFGRSNNCLTAGSCPHSDLCLMECAGTARHGGVYHDPVRRRNQTWTWGEDGSIRLSDDQSLCITAVGGTMAGAPLRLMRCGGNAADDGDESASDVQQWIPTGNGLTMYAGVCARLQAPQLGERARRGYCLKIGVDKFGHGWWVLDKNGTVDLATGRLHEPLDAWHNVFLEAHESQFTAVLDSRVVAVVTDGEYAAYKGGMAAVVSGWGAAYFDDFALEPVGTKPPEEGLLENRVSDAETLMLNSEKRAFA